MDNVKKKDDKKIKIDKWMKRGGIIGGIWGLIAGALYAWRLFTAGFSGHEFVFSESLIVLFLPAFLTHLLSSALKNVLSLLLFSVWFIGLPIIFGILIGVLLATMAKKVIK